MCAFRQCSHHSAQSSEGEGGEGHASESRSAAVQRRHAATAAAAGTQRTPSSRTRQQRGRQGHPAAAGEDDEAQIGVSLWVCQLSQWTVNLLQDELLVHLSHHFLIICIIVERILLVLELEKTQRCRWQTLFSTATFQEHLTNI